MIKIGLEINNDKSVRHNGRPFIIKVKVEADDLDFTIPINDIDFTGGAGGDYSYKVYTPDDAGAEINGTLVSECGTQDDICTITFSSAGTYEVRIKALAVLGVENAGFPAIYFNYTGDKAKLVDITQWGDVVWKSFENAFYGCRNLDGTFADAPNLSNVTSMRYAFRDCDIFNGDVSSWNVSSVENMFFAFYGCDDFNGNVSGWDVRNVTNLYDAFRLCTSFDQDLSNWKIESVTTMADMLKGSGLSVENYSKTLIGWANYVAGTDDGYGGTKLANTPSGISLGASGLEYNDTEYDEYEGETYKDAVTAKAYLTGVDAGWSITDAGDVS